MHLPNKSTIGLSALFVRIQSLIVSPYTQIYFISASIFTLGLHGLLETFPADMGRRQVDTQENF